MAKVFLVARALGGVMGGVETQIDKISRMLIDRGHEVSLVSLDAPDSRLFYEFDPRVSWFRLGIGDPSQPATWSLRSRRQRAMHELLAREQPNVILCFMFGAFLMARIPSALLRIPTLLLERNSPSMYRLTSARKQIWMLFPLMAAADAIVVQFERYRSGYPRFLRSRIRAIANAVPRAERADPPSTGRAIRLVFAGRYCYQKQTLELVRGFILAADRAADAELVLYGKGEHETAIRGLVASAPPEVQSRIRLLTPTTTPNEFLSGATALVMPSLWEGFPNAVAEALAAGVPCVGFSDCDGIVDLVQDGRNGFLFRRDQGYDAFVADAINALKQDSIPAEDCVASVSQYGREATSLQWDRLILEFVQSAS